MERHSNHQRQNDREENQPQKAKFGIETVNENIEKPAVSDPRFSHPVRGKRIRHRHRVMLDDPLSGPEMPPDVRIVYGKQSLGHWNQIEQDEDYQLPKVLLVVSNNIQILSHYCQGNFSAGRIESSLNRN